MKMFLPCTRRSIPSEDVYQILWEIDKNNPTGMRRRSDVSFRSHIGRDVADHADTSSQLLTGTKIKPTNLRRRSDVQIGT